MENEIGKKYNRLTIIKIGIKLEGKSTKFSRYKCECGTEGYARLDYIKSGHTKSCGCYNKDKIKDKLYTHKMTNERIYKIWRDMKNRCNNSWNKREVYKTITYDKKWEKFEGFYEDMKEGYRDNLTIDRIDNTKGYYKENCRWATYAEQNRNHSRNRILTYNGRTMCMTDWAKELGITIGKINRHIKLKKNKINFEEFMKNKLFIS